MAFADSIDISAPAGGDDPSEADDNMRRIQAAFQQRLDVDHVFALSGTTVDAADTGEHKKITFNTNISNPTPVAGKGHLYMKLGELVYQDATNAAFDLTSVGKLGSASTDLLANIAVISGTLDVVGNIDPTTYETTNGGFLDEDDMASDAADKVASQQSIAAHVAAAVGGTLAGANDSIGEITIGTLELKWGKKSIASGTTITIDFTTEGLSDCSNACFQAYPVIGEVAAGETLVPTVSSLATTGIAIRNNSTSTRIIRWFAIGR